MWLREISSCSCLLSCLALPGSCLARHTNLYLHLCNFGCCGGTKMLFWAEPRRSNHSASLVCSGLGHESFQTTTPALTPKFQPAMAFHSLGSSPARQIDISPKPKNKVIRFLVVYFVHMYHVLVFPCRSVHICSPYSPVQFRRCDTTLAFMYNIFGAVISL